MAENQGYLGDRLKLAYIACDEYLDYAQVDGLPDIGAPWAFPASTSPGRVALGLRDDVAECPGQCSPDIDPLDKLADLHNGKATLHRRRNSHEKLLKSLRPQNLR